MHLVLSLIFCGCMKSFKDSWMDYIEDHLDYVRVLNHIGGDHESERTRPYREKIMDHFGPKEIVFESDAPKFANRLKTRMAWMRLFNGDWSKQRITHYCRGCCIDRADCVRQIRCNVVAPHPKPEGWARARWLGSEDAVDWAGQLTYCHGMLRPVYLKYVSMSVGTLNKVAAMVSMMLGKKLKRTEMKKTVIMHSQEANIGTKSLINK